MRKTWIAIALVAALAACGKGKDGGDKDEKPVEVEKPISCPPGNVVDKGACVPVVTAEKVTAVAAEKTRLEELATVLDKVDSVSAPIELLDGMRQTEQWKKLAGTNSKLQIVDKIVATLNDAVKQLRTLKTSLDGAAVRLGNLRVELDALMTQTGAAQQLDAVRAKVSADVKGAIEPLAAELGAAIQNVLGPVTAQLSDASDLILGACAMAKLSGGGDQLAALCAQAKDMFPKALAFLEDAKTKPAALLADVTAKLETQLDQLIDAGARAALDAAQAKVNEALKLPPGGAGSGTGGSGSGMAGSGSAVAPLPTQ